MSKILIVGDIHWSRYSSIVRSRGDKFSTRLEHLIDSLNWVENISRENECLAEIFLGDTFDKPELSAEEITALTKINWNRDILKRNFIVGNHESGLSSLTYNSAQALSEIGTIEDQPHVYPLDENTDFLFLPYITEDVRKPLSEYLSGRDKSKKLVVFSHNDIKDFQMGAFLSKTGFAISDIEANCDLYINGHLHNGGWVTKKILNLGVLCGQNFSEDAFIYKHQIAVLDTDTLQIKFFENPYAFNFYKIEINDDSTLNKLDLLKKNSIVSIKCLDKLEEKVREKIKGKDVISYKLLTYSINNISSEEVIINNVDHLEQFKQFVLDQLGSSDDVIEELQEVCK